MCEIELVLDMIPIRGAKYIAIDMSTYDGTYDSCSNFVGRGNSTFEAAQDLFEQLEEAEFYTVEYLQQELAVYKLKGTV